MSRRHRQAFVACVRQMPRTCVRPRTFLTQSGFICEQANKLGVKAGLARHALFNSAPSTLKHSSSCNRFIYEKAHELGVKSIILDGPDSWAQSLQDDGKIEKFVGIDFSDSESAFERCVAAISKIKSVSTALSLANTR